MYMDAFTTKVFRSGNSLALRLPGKLGIRTGTFEIHPATDGFYVIDKAARAKRRKALEKLISLPPLHEEWPRPQ